MKALLSKLFAAVVCYKVRKDSHRAQLIQEKLLLKLVLKGEKSVFGIDHNFKEIKNYSDFVNNVPVRDYEELKVYIDRIVNGEENILWPGKPLYLSKTSGTTSGAKYIPISKDSIHNHIDTARNALLFYINETGNSDFVNGKMIFLQGSPDIEEKNGIKIGRLSGIVAHHVPKYLLKNRMPSFEVNCIEDWEKKVTEIALETMKEDMRLISGIPPWLQMYFEILKEKSGAEHISDIFPKFSLLVYGGVNYKPYEKKISEIIGKEVDHIELYPASEGFIAFQDSRNEDGMLLNTNSGIFYEFIKTEEFCNENRKRIPLKDVEINVNYAIILSSNAGLWAYSLGDTIKFVSLSPYRIIVTGRIKHFTSAFGEHVIAEEVEEAVKLAIDHFGTKILEFHVAPQVNPGNNKLPYHEWFIEFENVPSDISELTTFIDEYMQKRNPYYRDLRDGNILKELIISPVEKHGFNNYMKSIGKLGGQNKLPRLSNDRNIADSLKNYLKVND